MGACGTGASYPGKTLEQAKKLFANDQISDRYENGHSYSGSIGMLDHFTTSPVVFNTLDEFQNAWANMDKNHALWGQVKVVRVTKPLEAANLKMREANLALWAVQREKKAPSVIRTFQKRADRAREKYDAIYKAQAVKATKTTWHVGGWASS